MKTIKFNYGWDVMSNFYAGMEGELRALDTKIRVNSAKFNKFK